MEGAKISLTLNLPIFLSWKFCLLFSSAPYIEVHIMEAKAMIPD